MDIIPKGQEIVEELKAKTGLDAVLISAKNGTNIGEFVVKVRELVMKARQASESVKEASK
jgi:hypothetical protein